MLGHTEQTANQSFCDNKGGALQAILNEVGRGIQCETYNITCKLHYIYAKSLMGHVRHKTS